MEGRALVLLGLALILSVVLMAWFSEAPRDTAPVPDLPETVAPAQLSN